MSDPVVHVDPPRQVLLRPLCPDEPDPRGATPLPVPSGDPVPEAAVPRPREPGESVRTVLAQLLTSLVETLDGRRPVHQLDGRIPADAFAATQAWVREGAGHGRRYRLGRGRACALGEDVVEASAPIFEFTGPARFRARALALRLEQDAGGWRCVVLRVL